MRLNIGIIFSQDSRFQRVSRVPHAHSNNAITSRLPWFSQIMNFFIRINAMKFKTNHC
jgi:hypothetical protein